ncbi:transcription/translation regulatory transformer protein RfaH [Providencia vermicola]|uniref:Transcription antitermination protein RfaH n=1 Tax=Providencia vermicola TaxID=333965 RepID=A0AAX3S453_9GAMM|nr:MULTISPECIES: transcription/translation regulatory transformer protein RfaH [Providencia]ELX8381188.1 transcription/translation regulatory transformer protein RfaH [Providencia stuartii]EMD5260726.1 transcription/translation regulatory transformer protein RfaH [Providencia stuartii]USB38394.1 transcription/translation regulatory transformer protein RfaH [Providencia vermicola]WFC07330.1 transcription/translation regulatory transformer protein RfaH [Providencia vermicola]
MEKWYLLYCKRGQIDRAIEHLNRQSVICMTPMTEIEKVVRGKRVTVQEALFPNYLFVKFDHNDIHTTTIQSTRGVSHFVRFGQLPAVVPDEIMELLQQAPLSHLVAPETPVHGDNVLITEGIFSGIQAIYDEPNGESRSILLLNILNKNVSKVLDNSQFKKLPQ